jgi:hypothetical protein
MTYRFKETHDPMERIHTVLCAHHNDGKSFKELAVMCSTTPATISKWVKYKPDLKWYSLFDICLGLNISINEILRDTPWEKVLTEN